MIYTCTLNPSIDYLVEARDVQLGRLNRAEKTTYYPGGKGINVSRVLKNLGVETTALGYLGGFTGAFIRDFLTAEGIPHQFIELEGPTRINIKLKSSAETEINGQGPAIDELKLAELFQTVSQMSASDVLVLAGSLPASVPENVYQKLADLCQKKAIRFVVDTSGAALADTLECRPFLVKPNQHELGELLGVDIHSVEDAITYGRQLLEKGPENVIVSLGGDGAVLINQEMTAYANVPSGTLKNSVGAGDSTVAGFLASYLENGDLLAAFKYGVATGSATAFSTDLGKKADAEKLLSQINVEERS